jgi:hypothetical protein
MSRLALWRPPVRAMLLALIYASGWVESASAHVKWFCAYDIAGQPRGLENVLCPGFEFLIGLSIFALMVGGLIEWSRLGSAMLQALQSATEYIEENTEWIFRAGCVFFFISIWAVGGFILTPELKLNSNFISALQLGIAAGMISRRTMPLSAIGIVGLFAVSIWEYGVFHLADYPIFLGIAAYLALTGLQKNLFGVRPIDVVRWSAGVTLMWASIEKWAYPEWSFPLFVQHPNLSMGFDQEFFMRAAGAVEFALAFALMWTPLVRRVAAVILSWMFITAVFAFGKIDLIGHSMIIVVLVGVIADNGGSVALRRYPWLIPIAYTGALSLFLTTYYLAHALLFGTSIT